MTSPELGWSPTSPLFLCVQKCDILCTWRKTGVDLFFGSFKNPNSVLQTDRYCRQSGERLGEASQCKMMGGVLSYQNFKPAARIEVSSWYKNTLYCTGKKKRCLKLAQDGYTKLDNVVLMIQIIMLVENGTPQQVTSTILNATAPYSIYALIFENRLLLLHTVWCVVQCATTLHNVKFKSGSGPE